MDIKAQQGSQFDMKSIVTWRGLALSSLISQLLDPSSLGVVLDIIQQLDNSIHGLIAFQVRKPQPLWPAYARNLPSTTRNGAADTGAENETGVVFRQPSW
jgi:hypothetical protein